MVERNDELLSAYLDDALSDAERAEIETRLAADEGLRRRLESLRATQSLLGALPELAAPRDFTLTRTLLQQNAPRRWRSSSIIATMISAAASIALILAGMLMLAGAEAPNTDLQNGLTNNAVALAATASAAPSTDSQRDVSAIINEPTASDDDAVADAILDTAAIPPATEEVLNAEIAGIINLTLMPSLSSTVAILQFGGDTQAATDEQDLSQAIEPFATDIVNGEAVGASAANAGALIEQASSEEAADESVEEETANSADAASAGQIAPAAPNSALPPSNPPIAGLLPPTPTVKPPTLLVSPSPTKTPTAIPSPAIGAFMQPEVTVTNTPLPLLTEVANNSVQSELSDETRSRNDGTSTSSPAQVAGGGSVSGNDQPAPTDAQPKASQDFTVPLALIAMGGFLFTLTFAILLYERYRGQ